MKLNYLSILFLACPLMMKAQNIKLITLDPGHFHAALIQKSMYPQVDPSVHVYAETAGTSNCTLKGLTDTTKVQPSPLHGKKMSIQARIFLPR